MALVRKCSCEHDAQDQMHGKGRRVWNETYNGYRCTACGKSEITAKAVKTSTVVNKQTEK